MKYLFLSFTLLSLQAVATEQGLTPEQQQKLISDVQVLKQRVQSLEAEKGSSADQEKAQKMLETIQRGRNYQEKQQEALEELDAE